MRECCELPTVYTVATTGQVSVSTISYRKVLSATSRQSTDQSRAPTIHHSRLHASVAQCSTSYGNTNHPATSKGIGEEGSERSRTKFATPRGEIQYLRRLLKLRGITQQELEANTTRRHRVSDQILETIPAPGQEEDPAKTVVTSIIDLAKLNETQVTVLRLLSEGHMRKDIATVFGVSASRISQIFKKIAEKLRGTAKRHAITPP